MFNVSQAVACWVSASDCQSVHRREAISTAGDLRRLGCLDLHFHPHLSKINLRRTGTTIFTKRHRSPRKHKKTER